MNLRISLKRTLYYTVWSSKWNNSQIEKSEKFFKTLNASGIHTKEQLK